MSDHPTSAYDLLRAADHRRMRWLNNGGWTTEIIAWPDPDHWDWRVSVADIEQSGAFSVLPNVDRTIALLQGNGFTLTTPNQPTTTINRPHKPFEFRGDEPTDATLVDGPVEDLNLMVRRSSAPRRLRFVEVVGTVELTDVELAVVLVGGLRLDGHHLARLDAIRAIGGAITLHVTAANQEPTTLAVVA